MASYLYIVEDPEYEVEIFLTLSYKDADFGCRVHAFLLQLNKDKERCGAQAFFQLLQKNTRPDVDLWLPNETEEILAILSRIGDITITQQKVRPSDFGEIKGGFYLLYDHVMS